MNTISYVEILYTALAALCIAVSLSLLFKFFIKKRDGFMYVTVRPFIIIFFSVIFSQIAVKFIIQAFNL